MNTAVGLLDDEVVAVDTDLQRRGLGAELVRMVEALAAERGMGTFYLLTETADDFFSKLGYAKTTREALPPEMAKSELLKRICPVSTRVMVRDLNQGSGGLGGCRSRGN